MSVTLRSMKLSAAVALFAALAPLAQAQHTAQFNRAVAIQQVVSAWGGQAGPAEQFQATLNAASDGALSQLLSATSMQQVRAILLGNLSGQAGGNGVMALGDSSQDLVFTPNNPPCRVFDTRFIGAGTAPAAASTSSYQVYGSAGVISAQGGNATGCAAPKGEPVAVSANFTAVPVGFQGHIRVFPFGGSLPTVSFVNFNGVVGNNIANSGIVSTCYLCASDLSVYNGSQTHHIGDVMGYFYPATFGNIDLPNSTALTGNILKNGGRFIHNYGAENTFVGANAGNFTLTGGGNTVTGSGGVLSLNTTGFWNTVSGFGALVSNTTGNFNNAFGVGALASNTTGERNVASGVFALNFNTTGSWNTAIGTDALKLNTTGVQNTAQGFQSLILNTTGSFNTASGVDSLNSNTTGSHNTAAGISALFSNTTGVGNTASGSNALVFNTIGQQNTGMGNTTLASNTTGNANTALGVGAGYYQTTGSANIYVGNGGVAGEYSTIRIGNPVFTAEVPYLHNRFFGHGIRGVTTGNANAIAVLVDSAGQLGTLSSSRAMKQDVADMGDSSSVLMDLRPVTFRYKAHAGDSAVQYGLIAEEVDTVAPGLVAHSADGAAETVYYQHLAPMLVNEYQKQQRTIDAQAARIAELEQQRVRITELERDREHQRARVTMLEQQLVRTAEIVERLGLLDVAAER